jgi:hypothetical protein
MLNRGALGRAGLLSLIPGLAAAQGAAQAPPLGGVAIDHAAVGCIVAGKFPRMNACFSPASQVARARVYFRAEGAPYWYFVDMKSQAPCFEGILPKPRATIKKIDYYVEVVDKAFVEGRTAEYAPDVVADKGACRKDTPAAPFASKASVAVGSVTGAPVVPAGFLSAGVVGAGGVSTAAVVAGVAGAGAATAGVVSTTGGGGGTTTTPGVTLPPSTAPATTQPPSTTPSTTQPPTPSSNKPPAAVFNISPDPPVGLAPLTVKFSMCGSIDPDGDPLSYFFDFGDGSKTTGGCNTQHTYNVPSLKSRSGASAAGSYAARMSVTDGQPGHERGQPYDVLVGCPTPRVNLVSPASRSIFSCPVGVSATATDPLGIVSVEFFAKDYFGTQSIGLDTSAPYAVNFNPGQGGSFTLIAEAVNQCGGVAEDSVSVFISCYGGRTATRVGRRVSWTSQLEVPDGRGQVILNGGSASFPGAGRAMGLGEARKGENRIEAQLVAANGPGTWRFDFSNSPLLEAGSVRVLAGEVAELTADVVVFRLRGKVGERIAFTFRMSE